MTTAEVREITTVLEARTAVRPRAILILGSGLGGAAEDIEDAVRIRYEEIPHFPISTVTGHAGELVVGRWAGVEIAAMLGRIHLYEGCSPAQAVLPVRALAGLGPRVLVVTNAAGSLRSRLRPGSLMLIADHINLMWRNPLIGPVLEGEERFPDMSDPYDRELRRLAEATALEQGIPLEQGVFVALSGPSYETPAEVRMLAAMGADAVGMSTVPEALVARARGMRVLGISCITNLAAGLSPVPLSHQEVLEVGNAAGARLATLLKALLPRVVEAASTERIS